MEMNNQRRKLVLPHLYLTLLTREGNSDGDGFMSGQRWFGGSITFALLHYLDIPLLYFSVKGGNAQMESLSV